ncbi:uncharacterized protein TRIVIDRAFT_225816 [Trichoderma virens Gv29-8]|uniref:Uncharacterized protein n=1 Tax=Hypocrea virens (strain Gv29-8 / FGSC 10586) TaxID=413071 RepID=G9N4I6_HYPVG|nr:uncharacterized protein TRIVIDRAFT_225816 [Trichoderma virens Gv29-8]EHK18511.1 hypothetical protein TRIVIDRAFT_225816 [Trichoderma virens Gv29-8]UKZ52719.1 hypothetical protein TrVGV298_006503 [Trichoderma virens]
MSRALYEMKMDMDFEVYGDVVLDPEEVMDNRDILASYDNLGTDSDSEIFTEDEDKENEGSHGNIRSSRFRPSKVTKRQPPRKRTKYRLGPRRKLTDKDLDFLIYRDETADEVPPFRREYYGSNLPALSEIENGVRFQYAANHQIRQNHQTLIADALEVGDEELADRIWTAAQNEPRNLERLAAAYVWDADCDPLDVWLWVQDKGYHRNWTLRQEQRFVDFLDWMAPLVQGNAIYKMNNPDEADDTNKWSTKVLELQFDSLDLPNLVLEMENMTQVTFVPCGEDENILHRADFTKLQQDYIDAKWKGPGRWALGEEAVPPLESDHSDEEFEECEEEYEEDYEEEYVE